MTTTYYRHKLNSFLTQHKVLLAPMAGVSDVAMRSLSLACGADLAYTEMVSSKALDYHNTKTERLISLAPGETHVAVQLFGHDPTSIARSAAWVEDALGESLAYIDINMGCPARKIHTKGDGSALMREPQLAARIVHETVRAISHPVTVKFRRGFFQGEETAVDFAKRMEDAGASACAVHGRYAQQIYQGESDSGVIARVKAAISIPVVGNGDIQNSTDALRMFSETNCDSIMVARAARGNPWIFTQIKASLANNTPPALPTIEQRLEMARTHAQLLTQQQGGNICRMRKHAMWYVAGLANASAARAQINRCVTLYDFNCVFDELLARTCEQTEQGNPTNQPCLNVKL